MTYAKDFAVVVENDTKAMRKVRKVMAACRERGEDAETLGEEIRHAFYPVGDNSIRGLLLAQFCGNIDPRELGEYFLDTVEDE